MKNLFAASILILAFCAVSFAQTNQNAPCPAISVTGPAGIVNPGETGTFTTNVDDKNLANYVYSWTVSGASIVDENGISWGAKFEGTGKNVIKVLIPSEMAGESLLVTVEVKGLPEECPNTYSESMGCWLPPRLVEIDEFSISPNQIDTIRLNNLAKELENNPSAQIYITERFERKTSRKIIEQKNQKTLDYLKSRNIASERVVLINTNADKNQTNFFLVPAGAEPPTCDDCIKVESK